MSMRPHGRALAAPSGVLVLALGIGAFSAGRVPDGQYQVAVRVLVAVVVLAVLIRWAAVPYLRWATTRVLVTDRRIVVGAGVLTRTGRQLPLGRVADVGVVRSPVQRIFGSGTLVVDSTGERGGFVLRDLPRVAQVQRELHELLGRSQARAGEGDEPP